MTPTHRRSFRIPDDVYAAVQDVAADNDETVTDVVNWAFNHYKKTRRPVTKKTRRPAPKEQPE